MYSLESTRVLLLNIGGAAFQTDLLCEDWFLLNCVELYTRTPNESMCYMRQYRSLHHQS